MASGGSMASRRRTSLAKFVQLLVDEWSYDEVYKALLELSQPDKPRYLDKKPRSQKPSAVEQVERSSFPDDVRQHLTKIAQKFDQKQFLPTIGDIKHFLAMSGTRYTGTAKHRTDIFRYLLPF